MPLATQPANCLADGVSTVFLFDWDDTLLPTFALGRIEECQRLQLLREADEAAARVLSAALATPRSFVQLLTNAEEGWVWMSAQHMPRVQQLLLAGRIPILSAHRHMEAVPGETEEAAAQRHSLHEHTSTEWKDIAVRDRLAVPLCETIRVMKPSSVQVVTVGDKAHDMEAGRTLASFFRKEVQHVSLKAVRMQEMPTVLELTAELSTLANSLDALCGRVGDLACSLAKRKPADGLSAQAEQARITSEQAHERSARSKHLPYDAKRSVEAKSHDVKDGVKVSLPSKSRGRLNRRRVGWKQMSHFGSA